MIPPVRTFIDPSSGDDFPIFVPVVWNKETTPNLPFIHPKSTCFSRRLECTHTPPDPAAWWGLCFTLVRGIVNLGDYMTPVRDVVYIMNSGRGVCVRHRANINSKSSNNRFLLPDHTSMLNLCNTNLTSM